MISDFPKRIQDSRAFTSTVNLFDKATSHALNNFNLSDKRFENKIPILEIKLFDALWQGFKGTQ